jgi:hypothetical protein
LRQNRAIIHKMNIKSRILFALIASSLSIFGAGLNGDPQPRVPGIQSPLAKDDAVADALPYTFETKYFAGISVDMPNVPIPEDASIGAVFGQGRSLAEHLYGIRKNIICLQNNPFLTFLSWLHVKLSHLDCIVDLWATNEDYHWMLRSILPWITWIVVHLPVEAINWCLSLFLMDIAIGGVVKKDRGPIGQAASHSLLEVQQFINEDGKAVFSPFLCEVRVICSKSLFHEWKNALEIYVNQLPAHPEYTREQLLNFAFVNSFLKLKQGTLIKEEDKSKVIETWEPAKVRHLMRMLRDIFRVISEPNASHKSHMEAVETFKRLCAENKELLQSWCKSFSDLVSAGAEPGAEPLPNQVVTYIRETLGIEAGPNVDGVEQNPVTAWQQAAQEVGRHVRTVAQREISAEIATHLHDTNVGLQSALTPLGFVFNGEPTLSGTMQVVANQGKAIMDRAVAQNVQVAVDAGIDRAMQRIGLSVILSKARSSVLPILDEDLTVNLRNASTDAEISEELAKLSSPITGKVICTIQTIGAFNFWKFTSVAVLVFSGMIYPIAEINFKNPLHASIIPTSVIIAGCLCEKEIRDGVCDAILSLPKDTKKVFNSLAISAGDLAIEGQELGSYWVQSAKDRAYGVWSWAKNKVSGARCPRRRTPIIEEVQQQPAHDHSD